jgi:succinate-semialdehyde dehydrogenase/glutarate-semialdehyde dehydrogenase
MGPLITGDARNKVDALVHGATAQGARLMCGGRVPAGMPKGFFYEPTVLADVRHDMEIAREEVFGPVASLIPFDSEKDAVRMANDTDAGLASYLWTRDADRIRRVSESLQFGEVMVNGYKWSVYLPHMGIKESGIGADCSALALEPYLVRKRVTVACEPRPGHTQNAQDQ